MPRRTLTPTERDAWATYAHRVQALPGVPVPPAPPPPSIPPHAPPEPPATPPRPNARRPPPVQVGAHPPGVDRATWTRFRTGKLPTARTLDLHGRTAQSAHAALHAFLRTAHAEGARCVEIITGRGRNEGGLLRRELPHWLETSDLRPLVLAATHPHAANPGSVRLLLRRVRP